MNAFKIPTKIVPFNGNYPTKIAILSLDFILKSSKCNCLLSSILREASSPSRSLYVLSERLQSADRNLLACTSLPSRVSTSYERSFFPLMSFSVNSLRRASATYLSTVAFFVARISETSFYCFERAIPMHLVAL